MIASLRPALVSLRDRLPLWLQRWINSVTYHFLLPAGERAQWDQRLRDVLECDDQRNLPRHPDPGTVRHGVMTMHNGVRIHAGSYYGWGVHRILQLSRGCHEPQEERAFAQVLERMPPGAVMLELGAYWAFYSLWFAQQVPGARNLMVEPEAGNLVKGRANFSLNGKKGEFIHAGVGKSESEEGAIVTIDGLMRSHSLDRIHLLHSDIQGFEMAMLRGAADTLARHLVDYIFISTHSNELHGECARHLESQGYRIVHSIDLNESFSHDGLLVAQRLELELLPTLSLHKKAKPAYPAAL